MALLAILLLLNLCWGARVYEIAEPDLMKEIEERIPLAVEKVRERIKKLDLKNYKPSFAVSLPRAEKSEVYEVDMTYELEFDIPRVDDRGRVIGVLYPKGFRFNPLKHVPSPPSELVIFNPKVKEEVEFVRKYVKGRMDVMLLAVDTGIFDLFREMGRPIYYLHGRIVERLNLRGTVSIVRWNVEKGVAVVEVIGKDVLGKEN